MAYKQQAITKEMDEEQKPFACHIKECGMSFTNEDHLNVHRKKHDMILNFGLNSAKSGIFSGKWFINNSFSKRFTISVMLQMTGIKHI